MKFNNYLLTGAVGLLALGASAQTVTQTYNFTGGMQTFQVPCGVDSITITCWGGQGGSGATGGNSSAGGNGGLGGYAQATFPVTTGNTFNIFVGGAGAQPTGGFNGGGNGGSTNAGGGGGASDVRFNGTSEADRIIIAGGGGGGGRGGCELAAVTGGNGGSGGGGNGVNGTDAPTPNSSPTGVAGGGAGAVGANGGAAGIGCGGFLGVAGLPSTGGVGGNGGDGQSCCCFSAGSIPGGGGGGGGLVGGGGGGGGSAGTTGCSGNDKGGGGGGAGGTNYAGSGFNTSTNTGIWMGDGMITITYEDPTPSAANISGNLSMCSNSAGITLTTPSDPEATFYTWTVDAGLNFISGQNSNTIVVGPMAAGTYTVSAVAVNGTCSLTGAPSTVTVTVVAAPTVTFSVQSNACVTDGAVALSGLPVGGSFTGTAVTGSSFSPSTAGIGSYAITYSYTDSASGCSNTAVDSITVNACAGVAEIIAANSIAVTPNPAVDFVTVTWNADMHISSITVTDVTGKVVLTENSVNGTTKQLNVASLPAGTYTVSTVGDVTTVQTFVKK